MKTILTLRPDAWPTLEAHFTKIEGFANLGIINPIAAVPSLKSIKDELWSLHETLKELTLIEHQNPDGPSAA